MCIRDSFWLAQPGILAGIAEAERDVTEGRTYDETQARAMLGLGPRNPRSR